MAWVDDACGFFAKELAEVGSDVEQRLTPELELFPVPGRAAWLDQIGGLSLAVPRAPRRWP